MKVVSTVDVTLKSGIEIGGQLYKTATLREQTVGDLLIAEPLEDKTTRYALTLLCQQITRFTSENGEVSKGPFELVMLKGLTLKDLNLLTAAAEGLTKGERE